MMIITNFSQPVDGGSNNFHESLPDHTMEALDHYFIKGFKPGGFISALVAEDYKKALACADHVNRQKFWHVAIWLMRYAPEGSTGSYETLEDWCNDLNGKRTAYIEAAEKDFEWRTLSGEVIT